MAHVQATIRSVSMPVTMRELHVVGHGPHGFTDLGVAQKDVDEDDQDQGDAQDPKVIGLDAQPHPADGKLDAPPVVVVVGPPDKADQVADDQRDAHRGDQEGDGSPAAQGPVDDLVDEHRRHGARDHRGHQRDGARGQPSPNR